MSNFPILKSGTINIITLPISLTDEQAELLKAEYKQWLLLPEMTFVLDFKNVIKMTNKIYAPILSFSRELKINGKKLFSISMNSEIYKQIKSDGLENTLNHCKSLDEITLKTSPMIKKGASTINVEFINPFIKASIEAIKVQANTPIEGGKPFLKTLEHTPNIAICGIITISSDQFTGSIALTFPKNVFLNIYENMIGEKHAEITTEIQDACGEILNIIFGQAKSILNNEKGFNIQKALPTVLSAEQIKLQQTVGHAVVVIPFRTSIGDFYLEITAEPS